MRDELVATAKENLTALLKNVATEFDMKVCAYACMCTLMVYGILLHANFICLLG